MTTATGTLVWRAADTTENYNWIKTLSDAFTAIGFVKSSDTGQINLSGSTVALPASPSTTYQECGFEVRKLESLGKSTIYCRIGYGVTRDSFLAAHSNNIPRMRFHWGTGTDGAGTITGLVANPIGSSPAKSASEAPQLIPRPFFMASDGENWFTFLLDPTRVGAVNGWSGVQVPITLGGERTINPLTGLHDGDGFVMINSANTPPANGAAPNFHFSPTANNFQLFNIPLNTKWAVDTSVPVAATHFFSTSNDPAETPLLPLIVHLPKVKGSPRAFFYYYWNDIADAYIFDSEVYGDVQSFIASGSVAPSTANLAASHIRFALRYE